MLNKDQTQLTGNGCTAVQAETIIYNNGLSYEEVSKICQEIFEKNFYKLSTEACEVAKMRAQEITNTFLRELQLQNPEGLNQASDPDFQYDIFIAQKEYARSGDSKLAKMLIYLLIERTKEAKRSLRQIVLNESLKVASKLTKEEFDILTIVFVLQHHSENRKFYDISEFASYIATYLLPFWHCTQKNDFLSVNHLQYTGCGIHHMYRVTNLDGFLKSKYDGLPLDGFSSLEASIQSISPSTKPFFDLFEDSPVNHMSLTTVGIAIGYANLCRINGEEFNLSDWI